MYVLRLVLVVAFAFGVNASKAMDRLGMTDSEIAAMPPVCIARMSGGDQFAQWRNMLGPDFDHVHHYCMGINFVNRAYRARDSRDKRFNLSNARNNLMYMVNAAAPSFSLMPDVYLNLGIVDRLSGRPADAAANFNKAIQLNPKLASAYRELADFFVSAGDRKKALAIVTDGLKQNPGTKSLQRYYRELGGKLPYPAAAEKPPVVEQTQIETQPLEKVEPVQSAKESAPGAIDSGESRSSPIPESSAQQPTVGSPSNPYCRFCPE